MGNCSVLETKKKKKKDNGREIDLYRYWNSMEKKKNCPFYALGRDIKKRCSNTAWFEREKKRRKDRMKDQTGTSLRIRRKRWRRVLRENQYLVSVNILLDTSLLCLVTCAVLSSEVKGRGLLFIKKQLSIVTTIIRLLQHLLLSTFLPLKNRKT